ncbi:MAG: molybdopterin molybdenumtransferase MoeA, partial [Gammaproteobacteria bacterium]
MISYEEALQRLLAGARPRPGRPRPLPAAAGGVTAEAAIARLSVPGFANAAMDGYALHAANTLAASPAHPLALPVRGVIAAGDPPPASASRQWAFEILTGGPMPTGLDAVVPLERVTSRDVAGSAVLITEALKPGQNVRHTGEDFLAGQTVVSAGVRLEPRHLMALAACGVDEVSVVPAPRVAVLVTG